MQEDSDSDVILKGILNTIYVISLTNNTLETSFGTVKTLRRNVYNTITHITI